MSTLKSFVLVLVLGAAAIVGYLYLKSSGWLKQQTISSGGVAIPVDVDPEASHRPQPSKLEDMPMVYDVPPLVEISPTKIIYKPMTGIYQPGDYVDATGYHTAVDEVHVDAATDALLGTKNVGYHDDKGTPYSSPSVGGDYSWVSPELRATGIDPAMLQWAPDPDTTSIASKWVTTIGGDGRAYTRDISGADNRIYVWTPKGPQLFSGEAPYKAPIGAFGDVLKTVYGHVYSQEYWNQYGGDILSGRYD